MTLARWGGGFHGCGRGLRWLDTYRCRQCGRWMHGECLDTHFLEATK